MGLMGVKSSDKNKLVTLTRNLVSSSFVAFIGNDDRTESDIFAPDDLDRAVFLFNVKEVFILDNLKVSKYFSILKIPLSK